MNNIGRKIIAIGGGGFTHQLDQSLDQFVIDEFNRHIMYYNYTNL